MLFRGSITFNRSAFKQYINKYYYPLENMQHSVDRLKKAEAAGLIIMATMEYGSYQPLLAPKYEWPHDLGQYWDAAVKILKTSFCNQQNTYPISPSDPEVPPTKWGWLNKGIQKCFNSDPPIPILINVKEKPVDAIDATEHDVMLDWEYDPYYPAPKDQPRLLFLTIFCVHQSLFPPREI